MYSRLLSNRNFMALFIGQTISAVGAYFTFLAIPIIINRLTHSAGMVGLSFISEALPALALGPFAGVFVDRWDRRKVMIVADALRAFLVLSLLLVRGPEQLWMFYVVGFLASCAAQFSNPARGAALPLVVPDSKDWLAANGLMQTTSTASMLLGPALAGFAIGLWGNQAAFIANATGLFCSTLAAVILRMPSSPAPTQEATAAGVLRDLRDGLAALTGSRVMVGVLACQVTASLGFAAVNVVWIPYLQRKFGVGATGLGIADSALGLGMLAGGLLLPLLSARARKTAIIVAGLAIEGLLYTIIDWLPTFAWIMAFQFVSGLALNPAVSALNTVLQLAVEDRKRGRVLAALGSITTAGSLVSMAFVSLLGDKTGLSLVFIGLGGCVLLAAALALWLIREPPAPAEEGLPVS